MEEVTGPVIAIVLVLCAVFVPVGFLGGITGQLYKQFAITIAISVTISGFVALTLSPALCALMLKPRHSADGTGFFADFNRFFVLGPNALRRHRRSHDAQASALVARRLRRCCFVALALFRSLPSGFLPDEDQGYFISSRAAS